MRIQAMTLWNIQRNCDENMKKKKKEKKKNEKENSSKMLHISPLSSLATAQKNLHFHLNLANDVAVLRAFDFH